MIELPNKQNNVGEYLLYMWQMEDLLRAMNLDIDIVEKTLINSAEINNEEFVKILNWFEGIIIMMKAEGVQSEGHLQVNKNIIIELTDLHLRLLRDPQESVYITTYYKTLPYIVELRAKSGNSDAPEIETCFTALYGFMLLKISKKEITRATQEAVDQISNLIKLLSIKYRTDDTKEE